MTASPDLPATSATGRARWWRVGHNAGAQVGARIVSGLCQLAVVPLLVHALGTTTFGWAMALVALVAMSQFADLGVAISLQQALAEAWARNDRAATQRTYASGVRLLWILAAAWFVVAAPLAWWLGGRVVAASAALSGWQSQMGWLVVVVTTCVGVPLSAPMRLAAALQYGWMAATASVAGSVLTLVAVWAVTAQPVAAVPLVLVALLALGQIAPGLFTAILLSRRLDWPRAAKPDPGEMKKLWAASLPLAAQNLAGAALQAATPWAFAAYGGYTSAAAFAILQRLFGPVQQAHALLLGPLWPAYTEAAVRQDRAWVSRSFRVSLGLTAAVGAGVLLLAALLPWIVPAWLRSAEATPPVTMTWLVAAWIFVCMILQALVLLLLGLGRFQRLGWPVAAVHLITLAAMIGLGHRWGGPGAAAALLAGAGLGLLPSYAWEVKRALRELSTPAPGSAP